MGASFRGASRLVIEMQTRARGDGMASIDIFAVMEEGDEQVRCGSRECVTALEAVMEELLAQPDDTRGAFGVSASDEWMNVAAFRLDGGYEVHVLIGGDDSSFVLEI